MVTGDSQGPSDTGSDPLIGRTLNGRFSILEPIGIGGMGRVYRAQQTPLDRVVALKVLNPNFPTSRDPGFQKRFLREASLSSKLRHPNTVTVIDYGQTDDGIYYIAMEYLEGRTLGQALAESGPLPWARALNVAQQICRSVREAHNLGVVHRDLKPANIMILNEADQDLVKVLDFGLVKSITPSAEEALNPEITQSGTFLGSPAYMAPEQARNESDVRSDVYSLGVVLYQMLVGRPPFISKDHIELIFSHHKEPPPAFSSVRPDVSVPPEIEELVRKCLEKDPARRFQTMDELLEGMRGASMAAGGTSGIFKRPGGQNTTGPYKTPLFAGISGDSSGGNETLAVDISVEVPPEMQQARRRTLLLGGLVGGGLAALITGGLLLSSGGFSFGRAMGTTTPVAQAPAPAEKPAEQVVRFRLMSQPSGARVIYKGQERGTTPLLLEIPKEKGQDTLTAEFTFTMDGHHPETVITGGSGEVVFAQKLQRVRSGSAVASRNAGGSTGGKVERVSGKAEEDSTETALGGMSAPVMLESAPAPLPAAAPTTAEQKSEATASGGALAVPVLALSKGVAPTGDAPMPFQDGMARPVELQGKDIVYTREALAARVEGTMMVKCVITKEGTVENCRVIKGLPHMNEATVQALRSRTYKPITFQGKPVAVDYLFNIRLVAPRRR